MHSTPKFVRIFAPFFVQLSCSFCVCGKLIFLSSLCSSECTISRENWSIFHGNGRHAHGQDDFRRPARVHRTRGDRCYTYFLCSSFSRIRKASCPRCSLFPHGCFARGRYFPCGRNLRGFCKRYKIGRSSLCMMLTDALRRSAPCSHATQHYICVCDMFHM